MEGIESGERLTMATGQKETKAANQIEEKNT